MVEVTEKSLFSRSLFSFLLLLLSLITFALAWGHWAFTLDTCPGYNCGCVLYGKTFSESFAGGPVAYCQYVTYTQAPLLIIAAILTCYHGYRVFIKKKKEKQRVARFRNPLLTARNRYNSNNMVLESEPENLEPEPPSFKMAVILTVTGFMMLSLLLSAFVVTTDGFYVSCKQYRKFLVRLLSASGNVADILNGRMQCISIFDFMDYLQPDRTRFGRPTDYIRQDRINTGITLLIAKSALFMNFVNWIFLTYFYITRLRRNEKCCKRK